MKHAPVAHPNQEALATTLLAQAVHDALASRDGASATRFSVSYVNRDGTVQEQMVQMNRYWRRQLDNVSENTFNERECLMDVCDPVDWLRHFNRTVLPTIVRFELPIL